MHGCRRQILQYREDSRQLEACERLKDSRQLKQAWAYLPLMLRLLQRGKHNR
jgi:hypothetical protein